MGLWSYLGGWGLLVVGGLVLFEFLLRGSFLGILAGIAIILAGKYFLINNGE
jgi:hypothetical protein